MKNIKSTLTGVPNSLPRKRTYFFALCFITLASFGNNYAFNNPQALHESIKETLDITES